MPVADGRFHIRLFTVSLQSVFLQVSQNVGSSIPWGVGVADGGDADVDQSKA